MLVVIDTNVMIRALARRSPVAPLFRALTNGRLGLALSSAILLEYEAVAANLAGPAFAAKLLRIIDLMDTALGNVTWIDSTYRLGVITTDPDDNKFVDCAIAAAASFIITEDRHFDCLHTAGYQPQPIPPLDFINNHLATSSES